MIRYVQMRLLITVPILFGLSLLVFMIIHVLPGDAIDAKLAEYAASAEDIQLLKQRLGMLDPLPVQYFNFLKGAIRGDLGDSIYSQQPVTRQILEQVPPTLQLALTGTAIAILLGGTMGVIAAIRQNSWVDTLCMFFALAGVSIPGFWLSLVVIFVFALQLGWFPVAGSAGVQHLILPALVLGVEGAGSIARMTRSSMLEVLRQDFITTARAKGLRERRVILLHALRNALIPVVTLVGFQIGYAIGGAVIIETVFGRQGVGKLAVTALLQRDIPLVQGVVLMVATALVLTNLVVDLCYAFLDPRIRYA